MDIIYHLPSTIYHLPSTIYHAMCNRDRALPRAVRSGRVPYRGYMYDMSQSFGGTVNIATRAPTAMATPAVPKASNAAPRQAPDRGMSMVRLMA